MIESINLNLQRILDNWGLRLLYWEKIRDVYRVYTDQGSKNLKVSPNYPARLLFVHQAVEHLTKQGFSKMVPLIPTLHGDTYVGDQQYAYSLFDWIEGRQCDYRNRQELIDSAKALAEFHQRTLGFTPPAKSNMRDHLGKCLRYFEERHQDLLQFREMAAARPKDRFAEAYLANIDTFLPMAQTAISKMRQSSYQSLVEQAKMLKPFCHGDPAARNFILTPEGRIFLIDFDSCRLDLPLMDLIKFTRRVLKKHRWNYQTAGLLINAYQDVNPISWSELEVMKAVFYFPQKFWRLSIRYFHQNIRYKPERLYLKFLKHLANRTNIAAFQRAFELYQQYGGK